MSETEVSTLHTCTVVEAESSTSDLRLCLHDEFQPARYAHKSNRAFI